MKLALPWLHLWKLSRIRIEIKTSMGRFREKGGYIIKQEMQKDLFFNIVLVTFFVVECTFKLLDLCSINPSTPLSVSKKD